MTVRKSNQWNSKGKSFGFSRRGFLKTSAGAVVGATSSLAAPYVNAQAGVTLRFLNNETAADSQTVLRNACNEYESKFGVKIIVKLLPSNSGFFSITPNSATASENFFITSSPLLT